MNTPMNKLLLWLDDRTGYKGFLRDALYENIPGGARWRYVWGSTLMFTFGVQMITGIFLWMGYSPSAQTAWESVYYIEYQMAGGSMLRGVHHYTAQLMIVLLAIHLMQVVIDGAYKAPREVNFWLGLILMKITLGLALTGYLLPWDQKGYWATQVATKIAGIVPLVGPSMQQLIVGGSDYGHHTLTRFFALHAGVLPGLMIAFLVLHVALFRRHGIKAKTPKKRPDAYFWPDQVFKDGVACLAVLLTVLLLARFAPAELTAPADPSDAYGAARPEWYFLSLFQFLKFFHGETGEIIGAIVLPGLVMGYLFLMPLVGRWKIGHALNVGVLGVVILGAGLLTYLALKEDNVAAYTADDAFDDVEEVRTAIEIEKRKHRAERTENPYLKKKEREQLEIYFKAQGKEDELDDFLARLEKYKAYKKSQEHLAAVEEAKRNAHRAKQLASQGIPRQGALSMMYDDPKTQGPKLFRRHCASCHDHVDPAVQKVLTAIEDEQFKHRAESTESPYRGKNERERLEIYFKAQGLEDEIEAFLDRLEKYAEGDGISVLRPLMYKVNKKKEFIVDDDGSKIPLPNAAPNLYGFASREWLTGFFDPEKIGAVTHDVKNYQVTGAPYFGNTAHKDDGKMVDQIQGGNWTAEQFAQIVEALVAETDLEPAMEIDKEEASAEEIEAAQKHEAAIVAGTKILQNTEEGCAQCHTFNKKNEDASAPDLRLRFAAVDHRLHQQSESGAILSRKNERPHAGLPQRPQRPQQEQAHQERNRTPCQMAPPRLV